MPTRMVTVLVTRMVTGMDTVTIPRIHTLPAFSHGISNGWISCTREFRARLRCLLVGVFVFRKAGSSNEFGGEKKMG